MVTGLSGEIGVSARSHVGEGRRPGPAFVTILLHRMEGRHAHPLEMKKHYVIAMRVPVTIISTFLKIMQWYISCDYIHIYSISANQERTQSFFCGGGRRSN